MMNYREVSATRAVLGRAPTVGGTFVLTWAVARNRCPNSLYRFVQH
jgi:hypothetical protein